MSLLNIVGSAGGRVSRIALETLTLQCGALRSVSLRTMASNVPHAPATEESQESEEQLWIVSRFS